MQNSSKKDSRSMVEIQNLTIGYHGSKVVAEGLNAVLERGNLVCFLGANGTGKSTLIRTMCGFQAPLSGSITFDGHDVAKLNAHQLSREMSVVLTDRISVTNATVEELVGYGRSPYTGFLGRLNRDDRRIVAEAMERCGIAHKRNELISNLSDGERQKAVIAKAMAQDTPLIVLDEPTAFLDLPARVEIMQLLRLLASTSGKSVLMSTHDMELALQMADKLWILHKGGPLDSGSPEDLLLSGVFNRLFGQSNVQFDIKTGLFKVEYEYKHRLPVAGHGFHYTLLRRAFARKGIQLVHDASKELLWLQISDTAEQPYVVNFSDRVLSRHKSIEELVNIVEHQLIRQEIKASIL